MEAFLQLFAIMSLAVFGWGCLWRGIRRLRTGEDGLGHAVGALCGWPPAFWLLSVGEAPDASGFSWLVICYVLVYGLVVGIFFILALLEFVPGVERSNSGR
jgi:hypothetical protein